MIPWPTAHCAVPYSAGSPPEYQIQPLCGVLNANQNACASCSAIRAPSVGTTGSAASRAPAALSLRMRDDVIPVPRDRALEPVPEPRLRLEPEQLLGARRVEAAPRLAV